MPLPLLFIGIAAVTGALGIGKSVKAAVDTNSANKTNKKANEIVDQAKKRINIARKQSGSSLEALGRKKMNVLNYSMNNFIKIFEKLKNVDFRQSVGLNELSKFQIDSQFLSELKELGGFATSIIGGIGGGALGGALTAFGAYSAAGTFAAASTGTAIASLSGAAATNATLAFFGGGSLAAGGLGIAGGTMVLGGLVAGPAFAIMGLIVGAKASKAKDEAYSNLAQARKYSEGMDAAVDLCRAIAKRADTFRELLSKLERYFDMSIKQMQEAIGEHGNDFRSFSQQQKESVAASASLAKAIKSVLDTPILSKDGNLTSQSQHLLKEMDSVYISEKGITSKTVLNACLGTKS
jgi:transmembrane protein